MTMPHLMNCDHSGDGWCLDCVNKLYIENEQLQTYIRKLKDAQQSWADATNHENQALHDEISQLQFENKKLKREVHKLEEERGRLLRSEITYSVIPMLTEHDIDRMTRETAKRIEEAKRQAEEE